MPDFQLLPVPGDPFGGKVQEPGADPEMQAENARLGAAAAVGLQMPPGQDVRYPTPGLPHPAWINQRLPTGANPDLGEGPGLVDLPTMQRTQPLFEKNVDLVKNYTGVPPEVSQAPTYGDAANNFINFVKGNLLWLHDQVPDAIRDRSKLWYDGGNRIVQNWAQKYGLTDSAVAGAIAAQSPQKDWFQNVSLADRVLNITQTPEIANTKTTPEMVAKFSELPALQKYKPLLDEMIGKSYNDLTDPTQKAMWVRLYDQAHNDPSHRIVTPEGDFGDYVKNADGSNTRVAWGSLPEISKAITSIEANGHPDVMQTLLGEKHKVRNFYNNLLVPNAQNGDVTIDTHAVAAGLLRPLSGNSMEVAHNFANYAGKGVPGAAGSAVTGIQGTYPLYAEAYRRAAAERGILPREMQSITWEAIRGLFPDTFKTAANAAKIDQLWKNYSQGKASLDETRQAILGQAGGIAAPSWFRPGGANAAPAANAANPAELSGSGVYGATPGSPVGGRGSESPAGNSEIDQIINSLPAGARRESVRRVLGWRSPLL
jgi:hypothetical protein